MDDFEVDWLAMQGGNYAPSEQSYNSTPYTPEYDFDYGGGTSNNYGGAPDYSYDYDVGGGSWGGGGAWWQDSAPQTPYTPQYDFSYGEGAGLNMSTFQSGTGQSGGFDGTATSGQGTGPTVTSLDGAPGTGSFTTTPTTNAGVTGEFGMMDEMGPGAPGSTGRDQYERGPVGRAVDATGSFLSAAGDKVSAGLDKVNDYSKNNPENTRLILGLAGMYLGRRNQKDANRAAAEARSRAEGDQAALRGMQRAQFQQNQQQLQRQNTLADNWNQRADAGFNEAESLYNPQEMAVRSMSSQIQRTNNAINENERQMRRQGMSDTAIQSDKRRSRVLGSTGATTAYTAGLDTGRKAQQGARSGAANLRMNYGSAPSAPSSFGSSGGPDYRTAEQLSKSGAEDTNAIMSLLNLYLDDPITRADDNLRQRRQQESLR